MRIRPIPLAALIGVLVEALLVTPLYLGKPFLDTDPLWEMLEELQFPTILLLRYVATTYGANSLAVRQHPWIIYMPWLQTGLQAAIFALVALGAIYWLRHRQSAKDHNRSA